MSSVASTMTVPSADMATSSSVMNGSGGNNHNYSSAAAAATTVLSSAGPLNNDNDDDEIALWDMNASQLRVYLSQLKVVWKFASLNNKDSVSSSNTAPNFASLLVQNILTSLEACFEKEETPVKTEAEADGHNEDENDGPKKKKQKITKKPLPKRRLQDRYHIWTPAWKEVKDDDGNIILKDIQNEGILMDPEDDFVPSLPGGKLAQLDVTGLVNALAAVPGGLDPSADPQKFVLSYNTLKETARLLHRTVSTRVRCDILRTTPQRIIDLVAPDLTTAEVTAIRRRIYDTVVLGKGQRETGQEEEETAHLATARSTGVHEIEKFKKCECGNVDQSTFVLDRKNGDVICTLCGMVVSESITHEGSQYRKFEGEVDRNHHGDAANPLYSNAHNMSTTLGGVSQVSGAGRGGWGSGLGGGGKRNLETILRNAHAYIELNVSQFGKTDRRTRVGYKDKQKKDAFLNMNHLGDALNLHEAVVQRAKELFAGFRDDRELVQQYKGVIAACLCEAFEQLSQEGKAILKRDEQAEAVLQQEKQTTVGPTCARAARRNELHHANMAGKGGLLIDFSAVHEKSDLDSKNTAGSSANANNNLKQQQTLIDKPAATWDLEDCRSWLLDASRHIAQQWVDERSKMSVEAGKNIPAGSLEELEGRMVEHSIALCEHLEAELKTKVQQSGQSKRVVTPRVQNMSKLGIKWQHSHERGSGGKGGVGGSGTPNQLTEAFSRTAGQVLLLKTAKKLGTMLNDMVAGEAFHKELRTVISQQETQKRKHLLDEASRRRFQQMKRKPWLQARLQA